MSWYMQIHVNYKNFPIIACYRDYIRQFCYIVYVPFRSISFSHHYTIMMDILQLKKSHLAFTFVCCQWIVHKMTYLKRCNIKAFFQFFYNSLGGNCCTRMFDKKNYAWISCLEKNTANYTHITKFLSI